MSVEPETPEPAKCVPVGTSPHHGAPTRRFHECTLCGAAVFDVDRHLADHENRRRMVLGLTQWPAPEPVEVYDEHGAHVETLRSAPDPVTAFARLDLVARVRDRLWDFGDARLRREFLEGVEPVLRSYQGAARAAVYAAKAPAEAATVGAHEHDASCALFNGCTQPGYRPA